MEYMDPASIIEILKSTLTAPLGVFTISVLSNAIPFVSIPYLGIVAGYAAIYQGVIDKAVLVLCSATGATFGKSIVYFIGRAFSVKLSEVSKKNVELFKKVARKSLFLAILIFAATPLPDDILYIPLGVMRYSLIPYFVAILIGKSALTATVVIYASWLAGLMRVNYSFIPILVAVTIVLTYIILKVDWARVVEAAYERGIVEGVKALFGEIGKIMAKLIRHRGCE
ncbi:MAG: VTT domain-containing protein [Desulfurococcales archaeon]|nr:VTT domain-containing protein [Desulfurococcales archaeon]